jgi:hypothetical protein
MRGRLQALFPQPRERTSTMKTVDLRSVALALLAGGVLLVLGPSSAKADTFNFSTGEVTVGGNLFDAEATVTTGNGTITVALTNNVGGADLRTSAQAISDFQFTAAGLTGVSITSSSGNLETLSGTPPTATQLGSGSLSHWAATNPSDSIVFLTTLTGGQPQQMIIGAPVGGGYSNGNSGLQNFNPYVNTTGNFTLSAAGVTSSTQILASSVSFSFGTLPETIINAVPEPGPLLGAGVVTLMGLGYSWRRRKRATD